MLVTKKKKKEGVALLVRTPRRPVRNVDPQVMRNPAVGCTDVLPERRVRGCAMEHQHRGKVSKSQQMSLCVM